MACDSDRRDASFKRCKKESDLSPSQNSTTSIQNNSIETPIQGQYIVQYKSTGTQNARLDGSSGYDGQVAALKTHTEETFQKYGISKSAINRIFVTGIQGFSAKLSEQEIELLKKDPNVETIENDQIVTLGVTPSNKIQAAGNQIIPWGVERVGYGSGQGKTVWIIDTGIDFSHPELTADATRSRSFLSSTTSPQDQHGHGTHVAGIIGAKDNGTGIIGVAAGATLVALRALDANGNGTTSGIISAVDWVASHGSANDVVNMSLGGGISSVLDRTVYNASQKGILFAIAAGNSAADASTGSPARLNAANVYTISAMDNQDNWASFSNYGTPVDFCAPGVSITSTYPGGYAIMSGTSMATPHVAGLLLLNGRNIRTSGAVKNDPDGKPDPIAHK